MTSYTCLFYREDEGKRGERERGGGGGIVSGFAQFC